MNIEQYAYAYANICNNLNIYAVVCVVFEYPVPLIHVYRPKASAVKC